MYLNWDELGALRDRKLLRIVMHPEHPLYLLNYTEDAQYGRLWDEHPVLLDCRGIIVDHGGKVVAKPFRKFFNVGEFPDLKPEILASYGPPEITHKLDGSMVTLFRLNGETQFATRGAFTSPQARAATRLWRDRYADRDPLLDSGLTYIFEYTAPDNRIVVAYPEAALTLIGAVVTESGEELPYHWVRYQADRLELPAVERESPADLETLQGTARENFEGFVLYWPEVDLRVKVKLEEYLRLHRMVTGLTQRRVWEWLRTGDDLEKVRAALPEEMLAWFDTTVRGFRMAYHHLQGQVEHTVARIHEDGLDPADRAQRKLVAAKIMAEAEYVLSAAFLAIDGKPYGDALWKLLEPEGTGALPWGMALE